jgi:hypothetical protein
MVRRARRRVNAPLDIAGIIETSFQLATTFLPGWKEFLRYRLARPGKGRWKGFFGATPAGSMLACNPQKKPMDTKKGGKKTCGRGEFMGMLLAN